jgi:hypothetical protein
MSVEKSHLIRKSNRGFEAIADALLEDVYEEDLLVDDEGNVYALVGEIEKSEKSRRYASNAAIGAGTGATVAGAGLAGMGYKVLRDADKLPEGRGQANKKLAQAIAGLLVADKGIKLAGLGGGTAAAGLGLRAYNKKKSNVEKRLPSILRTPEGRAMVQAKSPGFGRFDSVVGAKMNMKRSGEAAARNSGQTRQAFIASGRETKKIYGIGGNYNNWMPARGKLDPQDRVATLAARRQAAAKASAARRAKATEDLRQTGRGVLP